MKRFVLPTVSAACAFFSIIVLIWGERQYLLSQNSVSPYEFSSFPSFEIEVAVFFLTILIVAAIDIALVTVTATRGGERIPVFTNVISGLLITISVCSVLVCGPNISTINSELAESEKLLPSDYISSKWFQEESLEQLKDNFGAGHEGDAVGLLYIGRAGCSACQSFEDAYEKLVVDRGLNVVSDAYYTSEDRDGARSEEMYDLLGKLGVEEVPTVLVVGRGEVMYKWSDPEEGLDEIERFLKDGQLPTGEVVED